MYREVGMLEVFVTCLSRYSKLLKEKHNQLEKADAESKNGQDSNKSLYSENDIKKPPPRRKHLESKLATDIYKDNSEDEELGFLVMEGLTVLLSGNISNCNLFRECEGAKCVHNMVSFIECRSKALG